MRTEYKGIEIRYDELSEKFVFEINGREKNAASLRVAKEAIDKAPKPKKVFERVKVIRGGYGYEASFVPCEVTSIVEGTHDVWISENGQRSKRGDSTLILATEANLKEIALIIALQDEATKLRTEITNRTKSLARYSVDSEEV